MARLVAQRLDDVAMTAREIPDIARLEVIGLGAALRIDHGGAHPPLGDERPFGRSSVPMQLTHHARLHAHRHAGDRLGDRQLSDGRLLAVAVADDLAYGLFQLEFEGRQLLARSGGIGDVVLKAAVAAFGADGNVQRKHESLLLGLIAHGQYTGSRAIRCSQPLEATIRL
jgi:hypothetical protein